MIKKALHRLGFSRKRVPLAFVLILLVASTGAILLDLYVQTIREYNDFPLRVCVVRAFTDALLVYCPFIFLKRCMWPLVIPTLILPVFCLVEVLYLRNFHDLIPGNSLRLLFTVERTVVRSTWDSLQAVDLLYVLPTFIWLGVMLFKRSGAKVLPLAGKSKIAYGVLLLVSVVASEASAMHFRSRGFPGNSLAEKYVRMHSVKITGPKAALREFGITGLAVFTPVDALSGGIKLSEAQKVEINGYFREKAASASPHPLLDNVGKNLIVVMVESFNYSALEADTSLRVLPTLHAMLSDSSIPHILARMRPEISLGRSADGHLLTFTGMAPLSTEPWPAIYAVADYPSLLKALPQYESVEIFCEPSKVWNRGQYSSSFGFHRFVSLECSNDVDADIHLFDEAKAVISGLKEPFMAQVSTSTMHDPYTWLGVKERIDHTALERAYESKYDRNYLQRVRCFDTGLGGFIQWLKESGLFDRSVIVIVADHNAFERCLSDRLNHAHIPFIVFNAGVELEPDGVMDQLDVFPTLLDVMGIESYVPKHLDVPYRGMGVSLLGGEQLSETDIKRAFDVSALLIESGWFK